MEKCKAEGPEPLSIGVIFEEIRYCRLKLRLLILEACIWVLEATPARDRKIKCRESWFSWAYQISFVQVGKIILKSMEL